MRTLILGLSFNQFETFFTEFLAKFTPVWVPETSQSNDKQKNYKILQVARWSIFFLQIFFQIIFYFPQWHILSWVLVLQPPKKFLSHPYYKPRAGENKQEGG